MWAVLLQVLAVAVGWQLVRQLPVVWRRLEALAASVAVGFAVVPWIYFLFAWTFGWNLGLPLATAAIILAVFFSWWRLSAYAKLVSTGYSSNRYLRLIGWLVAGGVVIVVGHLVILSYQFPAPSGNWMSNGNVWGDAPLHVALINQFSHGDKLDLVSPVYQKVALTYPLIGDLWSGVLMRLTGNWYVGLTLPSLVIILALLQLLFSGAYRILNSAYGAWLAWLMIVFSGSLQGGIKLATIWLTKGYEAYQAALGYSFAFSTGDNYLNFLHSHPLPQRAYSFGMPLLLVVATVALEMYRRRTESKGINRRIVAGWIAGGLLGLMPLVHTHSYMVMIGVLALASGALWWFERRWPAGWWQMIVTGLVVAAPQIVWQFATTYHGGFSRWIWGWMMVNFAPVQQNWLLYWLNNIGWLFVMILVGWLMLWRLRPKAEIWLLYIAGTLIFAIANVYVFQPSMWDNMKFFEYGFWMIMLVSAYVMVWWSRYWWGKVLTIGLMITMCITGVFTLVVSGPNLTFELLSADEVKFGEKLQDSLPLDAYLLVTDRHNSPVTMLANRKVLMTFGGWYNLYSGNWPTTYADRGTMLMGAPGARELIQLYGVNMAAFSEADVAAGNANLEFFRSSYREFYHGEGWWVFDLRYES